MEIWIIPSLLGLAMLLVLSYRNRVLAGELARLKRLYRKLRRIAATDALTGLANRSAIDKTLRSEFARARRHGHELSLMMCDLDRFKRVNDQHGHATGDRVLVAFCEVIRKLVRLSDFAGRYGGEEFLLILPDTDLHGAILFAERLRAGFEAARPCELQVTVSIGVASMSGKPRNEPGELMLQADNALYEAKRAGRNRVVAG